jgi:rhodanese-related sulfurtransferase/rubrerythrin
MDSNSSGTYELIDVRQPAEYAKSHIPGAISMPLNDLVGGKIDLPERKPIFVYSRQGGRSKAAVQWLASQDYQEVKEIAGGIDSWHGNRAFGPYSINLEIVKPTVEFPDAVCMAYAMEEGLRRFYLEIARDTKEELYQKLYRKLAAFEVEHKQALAKSYSITQGKELIAREFEEHQVQLMEGGGYADETLLKTLANTSSVTDVFSLAIAFETQAFDFYTRLAKHAVKQEAKSFFLQMADAEMEHLTYVTNELDTYLKNEQS